MKDWYADHVSTKKLEEDICTLLFDMKNKNKDYFGKDCNFEGLSQDKKDRKFTSRVES
jgi:hypothetical protein